jgi:hypothetical protein
MPIRESQWVFDTSESTEVGAFYFGMGGGAVYFKSPGGRRISFTYRFIGVGMSLGLPLSIAFSTTNTLSTGKIYMLDRFLGPELKSTDITGFCQVFEASSMIGVGGGSATVILLGMSLKSVAAGIAVDKLKGMLIGPLYAPYSAIRDILFPSSSWVAPDQSTAKAMVVMVGNSYGAGLSAGGTRSIGYVSTDIDI